MKTIIAGSRTVCDLVQIYDAIEESGFKITEVVSGGARGADTIGEYWAGNNGVPVKRFPADWDRHGKAAGPIRNKEMSKYAEALICIWDGKSRGSSHMIDTAKAAGLKVYVKMI